MADDRRGFAKAKSTSAGPMGWVLAIACLSPLTALVAAFGTRFGIWDWRLGHDILLMQIGWGLALVGGVAAFLAIVLGFRDLRRSGSLALVTVIVAAVTIGVFVPYRASLADRAASDVSTHPDDPPGFAGGLARNGSATASGGSCANLTALDTQVAPGSAAWALKQAGFTVRGFGVGRADGTHESFWFGFTHDATIRIRPGRTDVRVAAREDRPDGGRACQLARRIIAGLQTGE